MREYETMFVVQPEISDEGSATILAKLDGELEKHQSVRLLVEDWGKRKLAYEIDKFQKGHYRILRYLDAGQVVPDLERQLRLEESVLRFMTVLVDDDVKDIEARKVRAAEEEEDQARRAQERAERDAEEARQREESERYRAEQDAAAEAAAVEAAAVAAAAADDSKDEGAATDDVEAGAAAASAADEAAPDDAAEAAAEPEGTDETPDTDESKEDA